MIVHVWKRAVEANIGNVLVAAAENEIADAIRSRGGDAIATDAAPPFGLRPGCRSLEAPRPPGEISPTWSICKGTCRLSIPLAVQRCLAGLTNESVDIATIAARIDSDEDVNNPNIVKAIAPLSEDREVAFARDFVRELGPEHDAPFWHHIGVYAYRREALERFVSLPRQHARNAGASWNNCGPWTMT